MSPAQLARNPLARFLAVLIGVYAAWFTAYELWLLPDGRLDGWLSLNVAAATAGLMNLVGMDAAVQGRHVWMEGVVGVWIADGCNGITSLGLFTAFVIAYPGRWRHRLWFIPTGVAVVCVVNVLRIVALILIQAHAPAAFDVAHELGMTIIFYVAIFALWVAWARMGDASALRQRGPARLAAT
jgi:exosortase family protein XrtF